MTDHNHAPRTDPDPMLAEHERRRGRAVVLSRVVESPTVKEGRAIIAGAIPRHPDWESMNEWQRMVWAAEAGAMIYVRDRAAFMRELGIAVAAKTNRA